MTTLKTAAKETRYLPYQTRVSRLCLNPSVQKDSRGVLGTSFRVKQYSEILGNSKMADCSLSVITINFT